MAVGGFHLGDKDKRDIERIIAHCKKRGIQKIAPSHCTGDTAVDLFRKNYREHFVSVQVGQTIDV